MADAFSLSGKRIWVAGHRGMVGRAVVQRLSREDCEIVTVCRSEVDLLDQQSVFDWIADTRPDATIMAAARVGGIHANNSRPADFIYENLVLATNVIGGAFRAGVEKLLFLGSSCIYPKFAPQPIEEEALLTGPLEPTNEWYAIAKIAGVKLCDAFRRQYGCNYVSAMPTNLYGPFDNFDIESSHVLPALIRKAHEAKTSGAKKMVLWGTGSPRREFLHVYDCADAVVHLLQHYSTEGHINVGSGTDISIRDLASTVARIVGFEGELEYDTSKPDGTPRKLMSSHRLIETGWRPAISLSQGIRETYDWFLHNTAAT